MQEGIVSKCRPLTIEILAVQLLYELQHHSVSRPPPQEISSREALCPSGLSSFVFGIDSALQFLDGLGNNRVINGYTVELRDDYMCFLRLLQTKKVAPVFSWGD